MKQLLEMTIDEVKKLPAFEREVWKRTRKKWLERQRKQDKQELISRLQKIKYHTNPEVRKKMIGYADKWHERNPDKVSKYKARYYKRKKKEMK